MRIIIAFLAFLMLLPAAAVAQGVPTERVLEDGKSFELDRAGREFRAYCPARDGACIRVQENVYRFELGRADPPSVVDKNRKDKGGPPNRAMITGYGGNSRMAPGASLWMRWCVLVEPPEGGTLASFHLNIGQIQSTGDAGEYHTPPLSVEVMRNNKADLTHRVEIETTTLPGRNTAGQVGKVVEIGRAPFELGKVNCFRVEFKDSLGRPGGFARVWMNDQQIADYVGPTSRDNEVGVYPSVGLYRNNVDQPLTGWVMGFDYGPL